VGHWHKLSSLSELRRAHAPDSTRIALRRRRVLRATAVHLRFLRSTDGTERQDGRHAPRTKGAHCGKPSFHVRRIAQNVEPRHGNNASGGRRLFGCDVLARPPNADTDHELRLVHGDIPTAGVVPGCSPKRAIATIKFVMLGIAANRVGKLLARDHVASLFQLRRDREKRGVKLNL
jgi:hypothetical protein